MNIDVGRIVEQINGFWSTYGYVVILATGLVALGLVVVGLVLLARSRQRDRWVSGLTAVVVLAWTSEGLWEVARYTLGLPLAFAVMTFFVYEAMMISSALQAEQHRRRRGTPGPAGRYVWLLAASTATVVAANSATLVEALLRFTLPLAAAGLWWVGITAERESDTEQVRAARAADAARRAATWAVTPRTLLVAVGLMRPGSQDVTEAERERRVRRMVVAGDRLHSATVGSWQERRAARQLRRLARLASAADVAEVRDRVARATGIVALVTGSGLPEVAPQQSGVSSGAVRVSSGTARAVASGVSSGVVSAVASRSVTSGVSSDRVSSGIGRAVSSGVAPDTRREVARDLYGASVAAGSPLPAAELARRVGCSKPTAWRWIKDWQSGGLVATPSEQPTLNGHQSE